MPDVRYVPFLIVLVLAVAGCDEEEKQPRTWQQEQVAELNRQSQENSAAARALAGSRVTRSCQTNRPA